MTVKIRDNLGYSLLTDVSSVEQLDGEIFVEYSNGGEEKLPGVIVSCEA